MNVVYSITVPWAHTDRTTGPFHRTVHPVILALSLELVEVLMPVRSWFDSLLTLLFPDRCAGCARPGALFCQDCRSTLVPYPEGLRRLPPGLTDVRIAFVFESPLREVVHQLKYRRVRRLAQPLGELLAAHFVAHPLPADAVLPVPLHTERLAERGFNQAEALARKVTSVTGLPLINEEFARVRATEQQARLDARSRRENMRGAFQWKGASAPPCRILLVDDIMTTGTTMQACAEALRSAGTNHVYGLALARSRPDL